MSFETTVNRLTHWWGLSGLALFVCGALVAVGYRFNWGDVLLAYRHLSYDQGSSGLLQNLELSGPALGVNFRF